MSNQTLNLQNLPIGVGFVGFMGFAMRKSPLKKHGILAFFL